MTKGGQQHSVMMCGGGADMYVILYRQGGIARGSGIIFIRKMTVMLHRVVSETKLEHLSRI